MKIAKKVLMIASLSCLAAACLMLILAIFGIEVFAGIGLRFLLILSTFAVGCGIALSELNVVERRKILGIVSLACLGLSVLLALVSFCSPLMEVEIFNRVTGVFAMFSVLLAIIVSLNTKLEKRYIALQVITYIALGAVVVWLALLVCTIPVFEIPGAWQIFGTLCVASVGLLIATAVVGSKKRGDERQAESNKATSAENADLAKQNQILLNENAQLKAEVEKLKAEVEQLKNK